MNFLVLKEPFEGRMREIVQRGGRGLFAQFDYAVWPDAAAEGVSVVQGEVPAAFEGVVRFWLPHVRQGVEQGQREMAECGEWLCSVRVEITSVRDHEVDSTPEAFCRKAKDFVERIVRPRCEALRALDPSWHTPDVLALARQAHRSGEGDGLPMLADALEEAGCDFALLLAHCRSGCEHGGACWAVQLALAEPG